MKRKKINLEEDVPSIEATIGLLNLLEGWVPTATPILNDITTTLEEDCCQECQSRKDDCYCRQESYEYERDWDDYDRDYDREPKSTGDTDEPNK